MRTGGPCAFIALISTLAPGQMWAWLGVVFAVVINGGVARATSAAQTFARETPLGTSKGGQVPRGDKRLVELVVNGKVLVGNSGGEMGVRGWIKVTPLSEADTFIRMAAGQSLPTTSSGRT